MPAHFEKYHSKHSAPELFAIVADVEKYPEFLPWVSATRITERYECYFIAELVVNFKAFSYKYISKVELIEPTGINSNWEIDVSLVKGPFKYLKTNWIFKPETEGSEIEFELDFKFESLIFEKMIGVLFSKAVQKMTSAFIQRADDLLGNKA